MTDSNDRIELQRLATRNQKQRIQKLEEDLTTLAQVVAQMREELDEQKMKREELLSEIRGIAEEKEQSVEPEEVELEVTITDERETEEQEEEQQEEEQEEDESSEDSTPTKERTGMFYGQTQDERRERLEQYIEKEMPEKEMRIDEIALDAFEELDEDEVSSKGGTPAYNQISTYLKDIREQTELLDWHKNGHIIMYSPAGCDPEKHEPESESSDSSSGVADQYKFEGSRTYKQLKQKLRDFDEDTMIDYDAFTVPEREEKIREIFEQYQVGLQMKEVTQLIYQAPEYKAKDATKRSNRIVPKIREMAEKGVLTEVKRPDTGTGKAFQLTEKVDQSNEQSNEEESDEPDVDPEKDEEEKQEEKEQARKEDLRWEKVKREAGISDSDAQLLVNTFQKVFEEDEQDYMSYHIFEQHWGGEENALRMFQKVFENTELLAKLDREVRPESEFSWKKKGRSQYQSGVKKWVIACE